MKTANPMLEELESNGAYRSNASSKLLEAASYLWSRRRFLGRSLLVGLVCGALLAILIPSRYSSTAQLMPPDTQSGAGMAMLAAMTAKTGNGIGAIAGDMLGIKSSGALFVGVLRSRTVQDRLVEKFDLKKVYGLRLEEDARNELSSMTGISEDRKSGIITISVTDTSRQRAREMAAAYIQELNRLVSELSTSSARRERIFLEQRLEAVKKELDEASREFSEFSSKNGAIDIKEQGRAMVEAGASLQGELIAAESQLKALEEIYTPENVRVRSVQARVRELRSQLEKLGGNGVNQNASAPDASRGGELYPPLRKLPLLGVKYAELYRNTKIQEVVYETLTQQYELAKVQEAKETPTVKMLDEASMPERKIFPPRTLITLLCGLLGLALAGAYLLSQKYWLQISPNSSGKIFVEEVFRDVNTVMPWAEPNGSRLQSFLHHGWLRVRALRKRDSSMDLLEK